MKDNLKEALSLAIPGGPAIPVKNEDGEVIGYCGIQEPVGINNNKQYNPIEGLLKVAEAIEKGRDEI